jgi:hypothetical protein
VVKAPKIKFDVHHNYMTEENSTLKPVKPVVATRTKSYVIEILHLAQKLKFTYLV